MRARGEAGVTKLSPAYHNGGNKSCQSYRTQGLEGAGEWNCEFGGKYDGDGGEEEAKWH